MTADLLLEVGHATVADLDCVMVEDFVEHMIFRELFVEDFKEHSSNVGVTRRYRQQVWSFTEVYWTPLITIFVQIKT